MEIKDLNSFSAKHITALERERRLHPPTEVLIPLQFHFSVRPAKSAFRQLSDGQHVVQQILENTLEGWLLRPVDVWLMRKEFLSLEKNEKELLAFLNKYGWWDSHPQTPVCDFWELQEVLRMVLLGSPRARGQMLSRRMFAGLPGPLATRLTASFDYEGGVPKYVAETDRCLDAIVTSIQVDLVRGVKFGECVRPDCHEIFDIRSKHERKYCGERCRHLEVMRHRRENKRQKMSRIGNRRGRRA